MSEPTTQQLAAEIRQLRAEVAALAQRFDALERPDAPKPPADVAPASDTEYERAAMLARGIISGSPGAGGRND